MENNLKKPKQKKIHTHQKKKKKVLQDYVLM